MPVPNGENGHAAGGATDGATNSVLLRRVTQLQKENETLRARMSSLLRVPTSSGASAGSAEAGGGALMALDSARSIGEDEEGATSHRSSSGSASDVAVAGGLSAAEDCAYAQEAMDLELEFLQKQGELSEELEGLNASLALKQALLAAQPSSDNAASSDDEVAVLCETLASLENKLKDVETERDAFHRQVSELRMHSDGQGQPSKMASRKLEALEAEISRLKKQRSQQEALLKARQASDQRVKQLEGEIDNIKAQKVQITRRQREEAETHRAQRSAREREMVQLRRKGDKQAAHVAKLEGANAKQAMVLKRKNEEIERLAAAQKKQRGTEGIVHRRPAFGPGGGQAAPLDRPSSAGRPAFGHGAGPAAPLDRPSTGGLPSARKPNVGGVTAPTQASQNRLEGKREDDIQKAVGVMTSRPREWLDTELKAIVEQQKIREQVNVQIEMRRQAAISLRALEMRAEQSGDEPMEIEGGEDLARNAARAAEAETLRLKVQHHSTQVGMLQAKLVRNNESAEATTEKKFEALRDIKDAKALLKASLPQLVSLKLSLEKKEQMLTSQKGSLEDATDLANGLRLQLMRERKVAEERAKESTHALVQAQNELKELQGSISQQPPPPPPSRSDRLSRTRTALRGWTRGWQRLRERSLGTRRTRLSRRRARRRARRRRRRVKRTRRRRRARPRRRERRMAPEHQTTTTSQLRRKSIRRSRRGSRSRLPRAPRRSLASSMAQTRRKTCVTKSKTVSLTGADAARSRSVRSFRAGCRPNRSRWVMLRPSHWRRAWSSVHGSRAQSRGRRRFTRRVTTRQMRRRTSPPTPRRRRGATVRSSCRRRAQARKQRRF